MKYAPAFLLWVVLGSFGTVGLRTAEAASLYIDPATSELNRGDSVTLAVRLDVDEAQQECVNAVDAVISYTPGIEPVDVSIGESIFNVWVEPPTINPDNHTITFAGGIPNGYCGRIAGDPRLTNVLAKIIFQSPGFMIGGGDNTSSEVSFTDETTAYVNDGRGTKAPLTTYGAKLTLNPQPGSGLQNEWREVVAADTQPPEEFSILLEQDDHAFSGKYYIVFNTTDKQTGIDHYEVMEEPLSQFGAFQWGRADAPWITTRSPYVLKDQSLNSTIRVKALDKAGHEYIATLVPDKSLRTLSLGQVLSVVLVGAGLALLAVLSIGLYFFRRQRSKSKNGQGEEKQPTETVGEIDEAAQEHESEYEHE